MLIGNSWAQLKLISLTRSNLRIKTPGFSGFHCPLDSNSFRADGAQQLQCGDFQQLLHSIGHSSVSEGDLMADCCIIHESGTFIGQTNSLSAETHHHGGSSFQWLGAYTADCHISLESSGTPDRNDSAIQEARQTLNGDELIQQLIILEAHRTVLGVAANPKGGAHIFSNGATNPVDQSFAKGGASVLNGSVLIQAVQKAFNGPATIPRRKQQSIGCLRALDLSLRLKCCVLTLVNVTYFMN